MRHIGARDSQSLAGPFPDTARLETRKFNLQGCNGEQFAPRQTSLRAELPRTQAERRHQD